MYRSRKLLLVAWALLTAGLVMQVVRPDGSAIDETQVGGELAMSDNSEDRITSDPKLRTGAPADGDGLPTDVEPGDEVEVVLPEQSYVATVTTTGVATMAEPIFGAVQHWFPSPTQFGGDRVFLVTDQTSSDEWVKVSLPVKPNGQEGWIARAEVEISPVDHRALVDLGDNSVTVWHGDEVIVSTKAVTGKPSTPTPLGVFYVRDIIAQQNPGGAYGPYILALSGFSEVLDTFDGGLPALAIHGTNTPAHIGSERSSGCVRIPNELITLLADSVPLGTPVTVAA